MCGFIYNVNDFPLLEPLLDIAGYDEAEIRDIIQHQYLRPTDTVINLIPTRQGPRLQGATWWLATNADGKPDTSMATFNSKAGKLATSYLHRSKPRSVRSVVLARGFCEWQPIYKGGLLYSQLPFSAGSNKLPTPERKQQYLIEQPNQPLMLLASVSKLRIDQNGQPRVNTSIITLPPHRQFVDIHHKSFPLILAQHEIQQWLDPSLPMNQFESLFQQTEFRMNFSATPVDADMHSIGPVIELNCVK